MRKGSVVLADGRDPGLPALLGGAPACPSGPPGWPPLDPDVQTILSEAWQSGAWSRYHGEYSDLLTDLLRQMLGCEQIVLCASGTAAVELALRGLKIQPGDEVLMSAYDFKGNFQDVLAVGAVPVLVDVSPRDWQIDVSQLSAAVTPRARAILVSHLHGGLVAMPEVMKLAASKGLAVIEDACQMPGAIVAGRQAGTWGDVGVWSFGGSKLLTAGRGGAVFTNRPDIVQRIRLFTQRGNDAYPLSELQAAVLIPQVRKLEERNRVRWHNAQTLAHLLHDVTELAPFSLGLTDSIPGYYKLGFKFRSESSLTRQRFAQAMRAEGIALDAGFRGLHRIHSASRYRACGTLFEATTADEGVLTLHHPVLLTDQPADLMSIASAVRKVLAHSELLTADRPGSTVSD